MKQPVGMDKSPRIHVDVSFRVKRSELTERRTRHLVARTLESERVRDALISVAFVGSRAIQKLNEQFLKRSGATDVISFGMTRAGKSSPVIGDIYICRQVAARNAKALGIRVPDELARLVVHGTLHVLGYDHPEGATRISSPMWKRQERILASSK
jgi:probable rRNA maturation factor